MVIFFSQHFPVFNGKIALAIAIMDLGNPGGDYSLKTKKRAL